MPPKSTEDSSVMLPRFLVVPQKSCLWNHGSIFIITPSILTPRSGWNCKIVRNLSHIRVGLFFISDHTPKHNWGVPLLGLAKSIYYHGIHHITYISCCYIDHIDHARKTCVTVYLNLRTESQKYTENCAISEKKNSYGLHNILVLDKCCCAKKIVTCLWIFFTNLTRWDEEGAIINLNSTIILWHISGLENQRFKLWCYHWRASRQTQQSYFKL